MNRIEMITANLDRMSPKEKKIGEYIINHSDRIVIANIHDLAKTLNLSPSSISRFVRNYCNESFAEMKIEIASESNEEKSFQRSQEILSWADSEESLPNTLMNSINKACKDVLSVNDYHLFQTAAKAIAGAKFIVLFGVGASGIIAADFQQKLIRLDKRCVYNTDSNFGVLNARITTKDDVVIAISFSGRTKEVLLATEEAKKNNTKIITITSNTINPLDKLGDIKFHVPSSEFNSQRIAPIFSRYGQLFIVDILFLMIIKIKSASIESFISQYHDLLEKLKK